MSGFQFVIIVIRLHGNVSQSQSSYNRNNNLNCVPCEYIDTDLIVELFKGDRRSSYGAKRTLLHNVKLVG